MRAGSGDAAVTKQLSITLFWPSDLARAPQHGHRVSLDWAELLGWIDRPMQLEHKGDAGGYSLATFKGDVRSLANVEAVHAIALDFDEGDARVSRVSSVLGSYRAITYSTFSSTVERPRARAIIALSRPVTAAEYSEIWDHVHSHLTAAGLVPDRAARDASRLWYVPAIRPGAQWEFTHHLGRTLDVDVVLIRAADYHALMNREQPAQKLP